MDRRTFLATAGVGALTGCVGFFGPKETASEPDSEKPDGTGYDDDTDPGYDGDPLRVVVFDVPATHPVGRRLPVSARVRNEDTRAHDVTVPLTLRALDTGETVDSLEFSGEVGAGSMLSVDLTLAAPPSPGNYRVTLGDPAAPAAAKTVTVE